MMIVITMSRQVVLVGDATVGKTHLLSRYIKDPCA